MSKRVKDGSERDDTAGTGSLLSSLNLQSLKKIRVSIGPKHRSESGGSSDLERSLDDPSELLIHYRPGEGQKPIFARDDIVVNVGDHLEKKVVLKASPEDGHSKRSSPQLYNERTRSRDSYKSSSRSYSRSPSRKDVDRKVAHYKGRSSSPNKGSQKQDYLERRSAKNYPLPEKYYKDKSPIPGTSKYGLEKDRSLRERRDGEDYRKEKYRKPDYREISPKRYEKHRSRSHSPRKLTKYGGSERDKYERTRSSPNSHSRKYSTSPHRRRSRSPYTRKRTPSPRKRSHSPRGRGERGFRPTSPSRSKVKRRSNSPHEREHASHGGYGRSVHFRRHSKSPYSSRKSSRSPPRGEYSSRSKRYSRSPRKRHFEEHRARSRSPTSRSHKYSKSLERKRRSPSVERHEQKDMMPDFGYYGAEGFWIPAPFPRPGFMPRGMMPQMVLPRGMIRPGQPPYVIHRPYMPLQPHLMHQFRPRHPIRYNQPNKQKPFTSTTPNVTTSTTCTVTRSTPTSTATVTTAAPTTSNPIIEEPTSDSENVDSTVISKN